MWRTDAKVLPGKSRRCLQWELSRPVQRVAGRMQAIFTLLMTPIILLNIFGGIAGFVWLMVLGKWGSVGVAFAMLFGGVFLCGLAVLPGLIFALPAASLQGKGTVSSVIGAIIGSGALLWTYSVMAVWAWFTFRYFLQKSSYEDLWPHLLIIYTVVTVPWSYMAQKEQNEFSQISVGFLAIASAVAIGMLGWRVGQIDTVIYTFVAILGLGALFGIVTAILLSISARPYDY